MRVRVTRAHRAECPREDGSPGFRDLAPGDVIEITEVEFTPLIHERLEDQEAPQVAQARPRRQIKSAESA